MSRIKLTIPAMVSQRMPGGGRDETEVEFDPETGEVWADGVLYGVVFKGSYGYSPKAAGHGGRIVRYHTTVDEWQALDSNEMQKPSFEQHGKYRGGNYPSHYRKNTRQGAIAALLTDDHYFTWRKL